MWILHLTVLGVGGVLLTPRTIWGEVIEEY